MLPASPKSWAYHQKDKFEYAGAAGGFIDFLGFPFCRGRIFSTVEEDKGQYNDAIPVFWASGACLCIRSSVYHKLGGLDDDFFAHLEEIDLCWRILQADMQVYCQPASVVYHVGGGTLSYGNPRKTYLNFRNSVVMLYKNTPASALWWKMPLKLLLDWVASFKFLADGVGGDFLAVYKAHFHFLKNFRKWQRKKQKVKHKNVKEIYKRSIVVQYYLMGKKFYYQTPKPQNPKPQNLKIPHRIFAAAEVLTEVHDKSQAQINKNRRTKSEKRSIYKEKA